MTPAQTAAFQAFLALTARIKTKRMRLEKARAFALDRISRKLGIAPGLLRIELMDAEGCARVIEACRDA